jgi:predicted nucleic acid-binding Zn ribbon protein
MVEKERTCILCGRKEEMQSYICSACQDKIQREAMGKRQQMRKEAERALRKHGVDPDNNKK